MTSPQCGILVSPIGFLHVLYSYMIYECFLIVRLLTLSSIASWPLASALKNTRRDGIACATNCNYISKTNFKQ